MASGQDEEYLPHWLKQAGYRNEYVGKIMNGFGTSNYKTVPKGWDHSDMLVSALAATLLRSGRLGDP